MRNPDRILDLVRLVEKLWNRYPDMRLGQLLANLARDDRGWTDHQRVFYIEDDELRRRIQAAIEDGL